MKLITSRIFIVVAISLLLISACASEASNDQDSATSMNDSGSEEKGGDGVINLDYLLMVEFSLSTGDIEKEQATVLFRGPLSLNDDGKASVIGEGVLEGKFRCANKDRKSDIKFLGPGQYKEKFDFNIKGSVLSEEEFSAATGGIPLVPLTDDTEDLLYVKLFFPDGYGPPNVNIEGLNLGDCFSADSNPITPQWTVGLSGLLKGDGGDDFNQYVLIPVVPGTSRQLKSLNPELIDTAFICLAKPGETCDL